MSSSPESEAVVPGSGLPGRASEAYMAMHRAEGAA